VGRVPLNMFLSSASVFNDVNRPMQVGSVPFRLFDRTSKRSRRNAPHSAVGNAPVKALEFRSRILNDGIEPYEDGMDPVMSGLLLKSILSSWPNELNSFGSVPVKLLPSNAAMRVQC
jgi:hypothetical protein